MVNSVKVREAATRHMPSFEFDGVCNKAGGDEANVRASS